MVHVDTTAEKRELRYELLSISRDLQIFAHNALAPVCARHNITMQQLYVLMELQMRPGQTVSALSDKVGILHPNFPQVRRKLEERGLIKCTKSEADRRSLIIDLTPAGEALFKTLDTEISEVINFHLPDEVDEAYKIVIEGLKALRALTQKADLNTTSAKGVVPCSETS